MERMVQLALKALKVKPVCKVLRVRLVLRARKVKPDLRVLKVRLALKDRKVRQAHRVRRESKARRVLPDPTAWAFRRPSP